MTTIYLNIYRAGFYHRQGKPDTTNLHAGDVYTTLKAALEHAEPDKGYITTVQAVMPIPMGMELVVNPSDSVSAFPKDGDPLRPYLKPSAKVEPVLSASLEVGDDPTGLSYEEWRANRAQSGFHPAPVAHLCEETG